MGSQVQHVVYKMVSLAAIVISLLSTLFLQSAVNTENDAAVAAGEVPIRACGVLNIPNTTYVLQNNVRAAGTCFSIQADDITLDLRKHTVTYGVAVQKNPVFGVLAADCWYKAVAGNPCGGAHRHLTIMNGNIVQGVAAVPMSHAVRVGQAIDISGITIHGLNITVAVEDSIGIFTEYLPGGSNIYDNTIHNNVKVITSRSQFRGASIKLDGETDAKLPDLIHNNVIVGGAQLGIRDDNPAGTKIYDNDISQDATYANGFCIDAAGNGIQVFRNHCHPIHGRGIHANHNGVQIFDNVVETVDSDQIREYNGCEINGTYGIQIESDDFNPTKVRVYGNRVLAHAAQCPAEAMRLTDLNGADVQIYKNTFIAIQDKIGDRYSSQGAHGLSVGNVQGSHLRFHDNVVRADSSIFFMDWDSGGQITLNNNTFQSGRNGVATLLADFGSGVAPSRNNYFLDNTYQGFSPRSARFGPYAGDTWYEVLSSVHLDVVSGNGSAPTKLTGIAIGAVQNNQSHGSPNGAGEITFLLPVLRVENNKAPLSYEPYRVTLSAQACRDNAFVMDSVTKQTMRIQLSCN